jgi:hypothetical protein
MKYWRHMKLLADFKILALLENIGGFPKYWRLMKILADFQNTGVS